MSYLHAWVAKVDVALPRYFSALNFLSLTLLAAALVLPLTSSLVMLVLSMFIQAAFFRVMHREKAGLNKLVNRLIFLVISWAGILAVLIGHHLL